MLYANCMGSTGPRRLPHHGLDSLASNSVRLSLLLLTVELSYIVSHSDSEPQSNAGLSPSLFPSIRVVKHSLDPML